MFNFVAKKLIKLFKINFAIIFTDLVAKNNKFHNLKKKIKFLVTKNEKYYYNINFYNFLKNIFHF